MRVLFIGLSSGQTLLMKNAMERQGHDVFSVDPYSVLRKNLYLTKWSWHTGALGTAGAAQRYIENMVGDRQFEVAFVDCGEMVSARAVDYLHTRAKRVVLFNRDNPFVTRDGMRWRTLLAALPKYDLYVTRRASTLEKARSYGVKNVMRIFLFADETLHQPVPPSDEEYSLYGSPVSFVGTWFPERGPFMETLVKKGVPLKIIGHKWDRAANYKNFEHAVKLGYLDSKQYSAAVRSSEIAIAMLSKGNEDLHTARSLEIPAMGVLFCAERTSEHEEMYVDGEEAVFWSSAEECADLCLSLLRDPERRARIAKAGRERMTRDGHWTEPAMEKILQAAMAIQK